MNNVVELRSELCDVFDRLKGATIETDVAKEMTNTAGKIIKSVQLELAYAALRKERPIIDFLGGDESPAQRAVAA
jgi:hypothetical protein